MSEAKDNLPRAAKLELRLYFQASVPVETAVEGEELYRQLKKMLQNYSEQTTFNGQIMKMLEPCCKEKKP